jgi:hypothetical protein
VGWGVGPSQTAQEVKTDIVIHDAVPALQFAKMPCVTAHEHCKQLRELVRTRLQWKQCVKQCGDNSKGTNPYF